MGLPLAHFRNDNGIEKLAHNAASRGSISMRSKDHGWIVTFAADGSSPPQISVATEGGSGTPVPDLSIEVDDLDEIYRRVLAAGIAAAYGPTNEPWGVMRFYVRDPFGRLVNIMTHR